jgi:hypothetical protein
MPTSTWYRGELVRDPEEFPLPAGFPAGEYVLQVGLRRTSDSVGETVPVGTISLPSSGPANTAHINAGEQSTRVDFAQGLSLLAFQVQAPFRDRPNVLRPDETLDVALRWQAREEIGVDAAVSVFLANDHGEKFGIRDSYPPHDFLFTAAWDRGDTYSQTFRIPVGPDLPPGLYTLAAETYDYHDGHRLPVVGGAATKGSDRVALERFKVAPPPLASPEHEVRQSFAGTISLNGYDLAIERDPSDHINRMNVGLHWQALEIPTQAYTIFVHLYDKTGRLVAQHDGPPRDGAYPTTAWDRGETVLDQHKVNLDPTILPGTYDLKVGLYLPLTGDRLATSSGETEVTLSEVTIGAPDAGAN